MEDLTCLTNSHTHQHGSVHLLDSALPQGTTMVFVIVTNSSVQFLLQWFQNTGKKQRGKKATLPHIIFKIHGWESEVFFPPIWAQAIYISGRGAAIDQPVSASCWKGSHLWAAGCESVCKQMHMSLVDTYTQIQSNSWMCKMWWVEMLTEPEQKFWATHMSIAQQTWIRKSNLL